MERETLPQDEERLWRKLWDLWQEADEEDVIIDSSKREEIEEEIPSLESRVRTSLAFLQRTRYIQYRSGFSDGAIEPILYDVLEPED
ncbi:hypothetical protein [Rubrobacter aplysinae]|uniref:hypothetical protein n=1 Tax=Rubrobacter aplysinae TaxID=909625 RepID=UPI00064C13B7|nr:hypothetical protein [Rubrobacter aplysinae]